MDNPFEVLPAVVRKYIYLAAVLVALVIAGWQASEGNVVEAIGFVVGSLVPLLSASNTPVKLNGEPKD